MSSAAAVADAPAPKAGSKKKLILIVAIALIVVLGGAAAAMMLMKPAHADEDDEDAPVAAATHAAPAPGTPPTFVPLDAFTVNLADRDSERYAQIGITLQVDDAKVGDKIKTYMPAIRNGVLMVLSQKTSQDLLDRAGKEALAEEIMRETVRPLGIELDEKEEAEDTRSKKKRKARAPVHNPVQTVLFSSFIVQ